MFRKRLLASVLALTFSTSTLASIQSEMQSWFNEMGAYGNVTGAQIVKGQTTAVYTGGSMYMRTPIRNYQLASISPPSVRGGCGGIDLFAGSFSFINSEQLTALLRNTANNAIGYAFMMAVKSISPDLADLLQYLQDQASKINGMNLNSCQMAEGITTATLGPLLSDKKEQANAQGTGSLLSNLWSDSFQSFDEWRQSKSAKKQARQQAANADANLKEILEPGNVVWKALQKTGTPDELKELMMSMVGTIIIIPPGDTGNENGEKPLWRYVGPTGVKFADFVGNPESATKSDITLLKCGNDSDCMTPSATPNQSVASLSWHVRQTMEKATDNIQNRQGQTFTGNRLRRLPQFVGAGVAPRQCRGDEPRRAGAAHQQLRANRRGGTGLQLVFRDGADLAEGAFKQRLRAVAGHRAGERQPQRTDRQREESRSLRIHRQVPAGGFDGRTPEDDAVAARNHDARAAGRRAEIADGVQPIGEAGRGATSTDRDSK